MEGGVRLRTLADVVAHLGASGQLGLLDATEVQVRRLRRVARGGSGASRARRGRTRSRPLVITDADGRLLCCGQTRPGSIHNLTQVR